MENGRGNIKTDIAQSLLSIVSHLKYDEPLKNHTTFHIGGPAKYFAVISDRSQLSKTVMLCRKVNAPFFLLGSGSNVLFSDLGFQGVVGVLDGEFIKYSFEGTRLVCGAGAKTSLLVKKSAERSLSGLEILSGVPGTIGGAVAGNAGTKDEWVGSVVESVEILSDSGVYSELNKDKLVFGYRSSNLSGRIITRTVLNLIKAEKNGILEKSKELICRRKEGQPDGVFSAGSVFKNPKGDSAGKLIEQAGLKGLVFGGAAVSDKHANYIVNTGKATADDVKTLIGIVHEKVKERFNIGLELEIKIVG